MPVTFQITANTPGTLQSVSYDFNGDNLSDQTATDLNSIAHTYSTAGENFPVVTIQTTVGRFSSLGGWNSFDGNRLRINVQTPPVQLSVINITDPVDVKCDAAGNLYVLSRSTATIKEYDQNGSVIRSLSGIGATPSGFDVDGSGNVYVALTGDNQVAKFNPTTTAFQLDTSFGNGGVIGKSDKTSGSGNGEFNAPYDVAVAADGSQIAISDSGNHRIQLFNTSGVYQSSFGQQGSGSGQFNTPKGLAYDSVGYLYVVDSGNNRIALALSSAVIGTSKTAGTALGQFQGAVNLGVGSRGIYVAETGNNRVQAFEPVKGGHGATLTPFASRLAISTELGLSQPQAVAAVPHFTEERIYIADTGNNRVILAKLPTDDPTPAWSSMKQHLLAGDIDGAIPYFSVLSVEKYRQAFHAIGATDLQAIISQIPTTSAVTIESDTAQYRFDQVVQGVTITFPHSCSQHQCERGSK